MKKSLNIIITILIVIVVIIGYIFFSNTKVNEIRLDKEEIKINVGEKVTIVPVLLPYNAKDKRINWRSSNSSVASINQEGIVSGISKGEAEIIVETINGKVNKTCKVVVLAHEVEKIELPNEITLEVGEKKTLTSKVIPEDVTYPEIVYTSSDESIVIIDQNGNMEAIKAGEAVITLSSENGIRAICHVKVQPKLVNITGITLNKTTLLLNKNQTETLIATITPSNATNKEITWTSSNPSVIEVDNNGKVTAKGLGTVTITATTNNGLTATCNITVISSTYNKSAIFFGDSITQGGNGSWVKYIRDNYDLKEAINAGVSNSRVANKSDKWLVNIVKKYKDKHYDYVIMHGGINDIWSGTTLGEYIANDFSGNYDTKTVLGGLETYIYTVKKQWPNAKIGYIINYATPKKSDINKNSPLYYAKMMEVLQKWNVSYLNLYSGIAPNGKSYSDILEVNTDKYISDGVHLNRLGYELISPFIYEWMSTL